MDLRRVIAVDWSGAIQGGHRKIWIAEAIDGVVVRLENGRTREAVFDYLITLATNDPHFVVGFDFAFGMPAWFARDRNIPTIADLWRHVGANGESWLASCDRPFWGKPGKHRPADTPDHLRCTDRAIPSIGGSQPKSVFQIGGAGAVGTGSLRGMPGLATLHEAGFSVWPFDPPAWPRVIEIYPRSFTGPVVKSDPHARDVWLATHASPNPRLQDGAPGLAHHLGIPCFRPDIESLARDSEDAFDAAISAAAMWKYRASLASLVPTTESTLLLEGWIWDPRHPMPTGTPTA
ncbi:MAG: hypothetical protein WCH91_10340 [bacterium]|jgi:hypothetical protein